MIFIPLALGVILRVYLIRYNYFFTGELGKELLYSLGFLSRGSLPLIGMPTSHEWLNYGPIYYWVLTPLMKIFGGSPFILFWLSLAVSMIGIFITYLVFKKIVNKNFALILAFFVSVSPLWVWATRLSKLHTFFFVLTPLVIYFLYKIWNGKNEASTTSKGDKYMFWLGLAFGAIFSFHFSQIPIFLVIILEFWLKRKSLKFKDYVLFLAGLIIPNITVLIYDGAHGFSMIKNLVLWIPYRFAGFAGLYPGKGTAENGVWKTLSSFNEFFGRNLFDDSRFWILGSFIFICLFVMFFVRDRKKFSKDFLTFYLISSTVAQCAALLIHTSPPLHYFFPIFLNFGLLFSFFAANSWNNKFSRVLTLSIFILLFATGMVKMRSEHANDPDYIPLGIQENVVEKIIDDAGGKTFGISRVGLYDYFPENYDQNYKYLILRKGGKIDPDSNIVYTIIESGQNVTFEKNVKN